MSPLSLTPEPASSLSRALAGVCLGLTISLLLAATAMLPAFAEPKPAPKSGDLTLVLLNTGTNRTPREKAIAEKEQADHVGNFGRLAAEGRLLLAGPLGEPGPLRGIVVLTVTDPKQIQECFAPDPLVQMKRLAADSFRWRTDWSAIKPAAEPFALAKHSMAIVKKGPNYAAADGEARPDDLERTIPALAALRKAGDLALSGPLLNAGDFVGACFFRSSDQEKLRATLEADPAVKEGRFVFEVHQQLFARGMLGG